MRSILLGAALLAASCAAYAQKSREYTNPVGDKPIHVADPFVLQHDTKYLLFGTTSPNEGFQFYESTDLVHWKAKGWALRKPKWADGDLWAPEVKLYHDRFYMVYSARVRGSNPPRRLLGLAVSEWPEGPYYDIKSQPWFDPGFSAIDGHIFTEENGTPYLYFSRNGQQDGYSYGAIYGTQLAGDLSKPVGAMVPMLEASQPWEKVNWAANRCNEGPAVLKRDGRYYMLYSANNTAFPTYGMGYATAPAPLGPWTKAAENPVLAANKELNVSGPGHGSVVRSPDGSELFLVYHSHAAWPADPNKGSLDRVVSIDRLVFDAGKVIVKGPTRSPQPLPSGAQGR